MTLLPVVTAITNSSYYVDVKVVSPLASATVTLALPQGAAAPPNQAASTAATYASPAAVVFTNINEYVLEERGKRRRPGRWVLWLEVCVRAWRRFDGSQPCSRVFLCPTNAHTHTCHRCAANCRGISGASGATCSDTAGGFTCSCPSGYAPNNAGLCVDANECAPSNPTNPCSNVANVATSSATPCVNTIGAYTCRCASGFAASGEGASSACTDIDECAAAFANTVTCARFAACGNTPGSFACTCPAGYYGDGLLWGTGCTEDADDRIGWLGMLLVCLGVVVVTLAVVAGLWCCLGAKNRRGDRRMQKQQSTVMPASSVPASASDKYSVPGAGAYDNGNGNGNGADPFNAPNWSGPCEVAVPVAPVAAHQPAHAGHGRLVLTPIEPKAVAQLEGNGTHD